MLTRRYETTVDLGNDTEPFFISNGKTVSRDYLSEITSSELKRPQLKVATHGDDFMESLNSGYTDDDGSAIRPDEEILKAFRGEDTPWKIVRCVLTYSGVVFVVVNPSIYGKEKVGFHAPDYGSQEGEMREGRVFVWIDWSLCSGVKFGVGIRKLKRAKNCGKSRLKIRQRYEVVVTDIYYEFTEYYKKFDRHSRIARKENINGDNIVEVTEHYY